MEYKKIAFDLKNLCQEQTKVIIRLENSIKGKTLIGTCGNCKWWGNDNNEIQCDNMDVFMMFVARNGVKMPPQDFGCIHFKEKI